MTLLARPWSFGLRNKYMILVILFFTISWTYVYFHSSHLITSNQSFKSIECYRLRKETLPDISTVDVRQGKSIFFHETSCNSYINDKIVINRRQACAVESAALMNPNLDVYLTFTSPGVFKFEDTDSDRFLKALMSYSNIRINHLNYEKYTKGTPVEELYSRGAIEGSHYAMSHASDVLRASTVDVRKGKSIFFHETSCSSYLNDKIIINPRQACAVESAALMNPNFDVYLTFTSPGVFKFENTASDRFLKALMSYSNVKIHHLNYENYTKGTPVEELYSKGAVEGSHYAMSHASDILRYLTLWKYGGIYLDLDVVVIKSLESLPPNFSGCQFKNQVAAGILGFEPSGAEGHKLATECLMDLKEKFNGTIWGHNGPGVITRMGEKHCQVKKNRISDICNRTCDNFHIFSTEWFYPIHWKSWKQFFQEKDTGEVTTATENSYIIHVWNKFSVLTKLPVQSLSAYTTFAKKYCPKVFQQCDIYF